MDRLKEILLIIMILFIITGCSSNNGIMYSLDKNYYWANTDDYYENDGKYYFKINSKIFRFYEDNTCEIFYVNGKSILDDAIFSKDVKYYNSKGEIADTYGAYISDNIECSYVAEEGKIHILPEYSYSSVEINDTSYVIDEKYLELYFGKYKIDDENLIIKWDGQKSESIYNRISFDEWIEVYDKEKIDKYYVVDSQKYILSSEYETGGLHIGYGFKSYEYDIASLISDYENENNVKIDMNLFKSLNSPKFKIYNNDSRAYATSILSSEDNFFYMPTRILSYEELTKKIATEYNVDSKDILILKDGNIIKSGINDTDYDVLIKYDKNTISKMKNK